MKAVLILMIICYITALTFQLASLKILSSDVVQPETNVTLNLNFLDSNGYSYSCNLTDNGLLKQQFNVIPNSNNYTYVTYYYIKELGVHNVSVYCVYNLIDVADTKTIFSEIHDGLLAVINSLSVVFLPAFVVIAGAFFIQNKILENSQEIRNTIIILFILSFVIIGFLSHMSNEKNIEDYINYKITDDAYRENTAKNYQFIFQISLLVFWLVIIYAIWYAIKFFSSQAPTENEKR